MDDLTRLALVSQFTAAIETLTNAVNACPDELWARPEGQGPEGFWYRVYHTTFWTDLYLEGAIEGYSPPPPFGLEELDPAGLIPDHIATKDQLLNWLAMCDAKCRTKIAALTDQTAARICRFPRREMSYLELLLYNLRHVQHHAAQLNLILRREAAIGMKWVRRGKAV